MSTRRMIYKSQVRTIEDVVDAWKPDHRKAMRVRDIEEIIKVCLFAHQVFCDWLVEIWECASSGNLASPQADGEVFRHMAQQSFEAMLQLQPLIAWAKKNGYSVENQNDFERMLSDFEKRRKDFLARWPFVNQQQIEQSRAEFASGEYQTAEDVLHELQDVNSEQH